MSSQVKREVESDCIGETGDAGSAPGVAGTMEKEKGSRTSGSGRSSKRDSIEDLQCPICMDLFIDPTITDCSHVFCNFCITYWFANRGSSICPQCRNTVACMVPATAIQEKVERYVSENYSKEMQEERERTKEARQNHEEVGFTQDEMAILDEYLALDRTVGDDGNNVDDIFWQMTAESPFPAATSFAAWSYSGLTPSTVYTSLADTMDESEEAVGAAHTRVGADGMSGPTMDETLQQFEFRLERAQRAYGILVSAQREMNHQLTHLHSISQRLERYNNQVLRTRLNSQLSDNRESRGRMGGSEGVVRNMGVVRRGSESLLTTGSELRFMETDRMNTENARRCPAQTRRENSSQERRCHLSEYESRQSMLNIDRHNNMESSESNYSTVLPELYRTMHPLSSTSELPRVCQRRASNASTCLNGNHPASDICRNDTAALPSLGISVRSTSSLNIFRPRHRRGRRCCNPIEITTTIYGDDPVQNMLSRERAEEQELSQAVGQALMMEILEPSYGNRLSTSSTRPSHDIQLPSLSSDSYSSTDYLSSDTASDSRYRRYLLVNPRRRYGNNHGSSN